MTARYETEAISRDDSVAFVPGGLEVRVSSPLAEEFDPTASNPEQLLALAWANCLNSTAQAVLGGERRSQVRVEVGLHEASPSPGYEFHVDGFLSVEGADQEEVQRVLNAAHGRCPVSKLLSASRTVRVHVERYDSSAQSGNPRSS